MEFKRIAVDTSKFLFTRKRPLMAAYSAGSGYASLLAQ